MRMALDKVNLPTIAVLLALAAVAAYAVASYRRKLKSGCCGAGGDKVTRVAQAEKPTDYPHHKIALIDGMHCENCAARVANAFRQEGGMMARVSLAKKQADVYSRELLDDGRIRQIVARAGYMVTGIREG